MKQVEDHIESEPIDLPVGSVIVDIEGQLLQKDESDRWIDLDYFVPSTKINFPVEVVRVGNAK